jgi:hypothetical protein
MNMKKPKPTDPPNLKPPKLGTQKIIEDLQYRIAELEEELAEARDTIARLEAAAGSQTP